MKNYIYKCVPLLLEPSTEENYLTTTALAYEKVLNVAGKEGWELVKIDTLSLIQTDADYPTENISATATGCAKILILRKSSVALPEETIGAGLAKMENQPACPACFSKVNKEDLFCENCSFKLN